MAKAECPSGKTVMTRKAAMSEAAHRRRSMLATVEHFHCGRCGGWHVRRYFATKNRRRRGRAQRKKG